MGAVPTLDKLPAAKRALGGERVRNYQANLAALELSVFEEFNNQKNEDDKSQQAKLNQKKVRTRRKGAGGSRLFKSSTKSDKE